MIHFTRERETVHVSTQALANRFGEVSAIQMFGSLIPLVYTWPQIHMVALLSISASLEQLIRQQAIFARIADGVFD